MSRATYSPLFFVGSLFFVAIAGCAIPGLNMSMGSKTPASTASTTETENRSEAEPILDPEQQWARDNDPNYDPMTWPRAKRDPNARAEATPFCLSGTTACHGKCVDYHYDDNNCGGCDSKCSDGKHCDGHLSCRDAAGNL
jgi:hypothetical protein